jgi:hypothetical protein
MYKPGGLIAMKKPVVDPRQLSLDELFELPRPAAATPASMDHGLEVRHILSDALKKSPKTRYEIAARMSELTGHDISKSMLDAWTAESRGPWRFPYEFADAFESACETHCLTEFLARKRGCRVYAGDEIRQAEVGRLESQINELATRLKALKRARVVG